MVEVSKEELLLDEISVLKSALLSAKKRLDDIEEWQAKHLGNDWGRSNVNSPHPNISANTIESGGGIIRQDENGMQIAWDSTSENTGVVFTDRFSNDPLTHVPSGGLRGRVDTDAGLALSQIYAAYTDVDLASYVTAANGPAANIIDLHARDATSSDFGRLVIYANLPYAQLTGVAYRSNLSSDPSSLYEGMFWYNATDDVFRGYRGSSKLEFLMDGDVSGMNKVTGSGYLVMPSAATGIDPANSGSAWTSGAWSEVKSSTSEADSIIGIIYGWDGINNNSSVEAEIDIGTGSAASEVAVTTIPLLKQQLAAGGVGSDADEMSIDMRAIMFPAPIEVANGTRIAVRVRSSDTGIEPANIRLIYTKAAELVAR